MQQSGSAGQPQVSVDERCIAAGHPVVDRIHRALALTGGTTGKGKCAMYSIDNWMACRDAAFINTDLGLSSATRLLHVSQLSHGTLMLFFPTVYGGGTNLTMNQLDMESWRQQVEQERVTHSFLVPTVLYRLL